MLDYAKVILPKVSFSRQLFRKELVKCINWLEPSEVRELHDWCYLNFKEIYPDVLEEVFSYVAA
ncbi:MAG: hypothetical protein PHN68_04760 [Prolixibacteraceae bacterium]|jgi:hypothetical protein|nr:hypothetical protein [Prolixibacteraceae bacterium]MDD4756384.1 hypothetical protein [Prolixibacteraceae bacterium]NLO02473.1 hypothetical protein [Bacteroidales bacterium]